MRASYAAKAYSSVDISSKTDNRRPEELIVLLFDKACSCLRRASMLPVETMHELELTERLALLEDFHKNTSKAMQIVVALREMLDMDAGGEVSQQLANTYTAIYRSIWAATKAKNTADLAKLFEALAELRSGWEVVANNSSA